MPLIIPAILGGLSLAGTLFGGGARGAREARQTNDRILQDRDRNQILADRAFEDSLINRGQLDLDQRRFQEEVPNTRLGRSGALDRIRNFDQRAGAFSESPHTFNINGREVTVPRTNIDFSAFAPSAERRSLADLIAARDLEAQTAGDQFGPLPELQRTQLSPLSKPGGLEKLGGFLGGLGGVADVIGNVGGALGAFGPTPTGESNIPPSAILKDVNFGTPGIMPGGPPGTGTQVLPGSLFGGRSPFSFSDRVKR